MDTSSKITVVTNDGVSIDLPRRYIHYSKVLNDMLKTQPDTDDIVIPLSGVSSEFMNIAIEWFALNDPLDVKLDELTKVATETNVADSDEVTKLNTEKKSRIDEFCEKYADKSYHLLVVADYLNAEHMLDSMADFIVKQISDMTPAQIRKHLHIKDDLTDEEKAEIKKKAAALGVDIKEEENDVEMKDGNAEDVAAEDASSTSVST